MDDLLHRVQQAQFKDRAYAERVLLGFLQQTFALDVISVQLRPLAVSLNSFNGFLNLADGRRLFFKTHTEPGSVIDEYYNASTLAEAGYPVVAPLYSSTKAGRQLLIYEVIDDPSVFDVAWTIDNGDPTLLEPLRAAQAAADDAVAGIYQQTLAQGEPTAAAPVHQLFYHRLTGGRRALFYPDHAKVSLPGGTLDTRDIMAAHWRVNGQVYTQTLAELVTRAGQLLQPTREGPSIVGHGDAHNGNVFFRVADRSLVYFDPAFAGRHDPLLDLAKPIFHNVFAMWMYFPDIMRQRLTIEASIGPAGIVVEHDHHLTAVRRMFLDSKVSRVLTPMVAELSRRGWLEPHWRRRLKAALLCCPLLTMNLTDRHRFSPEIGLLGLAYAVEMGGDSVGERSVIDQALDNVEAALR